MRTDIVQLPFNCWKLCPGKADIHCKTTSQLLGIISW